MTTHTRKPTHGIEFIHNTDEVLYRRIQPIPEPFTASNTLSSVNFDVEGSRELSLGDRHYVLNGISTCVLNICLSLGTEMRDRDAFIDPGAIYKYHAEYSNNTLHSTEFIRAVEAFEGIAEDAFGDETTFIERTAHGSGNRARYRISPTISFTDLRQK